MPMMIHCVKLRIRRVLAVFVCVGITFILLLWLLPYDDEIDDSTAFTNYIEGKIIEELTSYEFQHGIKSTHIPTFRARNISCAALFAKDEYEQAMALSRQFSYVKKPLPESTYVERTRNCSNFVGKRRYVMHPLSADEATFSIAYSIVIYKDIEQFERLLRAIYRPQNIYCIHVDLKSPPMFRKAAITIANCFHNVFVASQAVDVVWGEYSVLEADFICMEELLKRSKRWRYIINLTGQEFPLKTNGELVKILRIFNGSNNIEGTILRMNPVLKSEYEDPPGDIKITKGSVHITATRAFVSYVIYHPIARTFRKWIKNVRIPDELFFSSLNHSPHLGIPGAYTAIKDDIAPSGFLVIHSSRMGCKKRSGGGIAVIHRSDINISLMKASFTTAVSFESQCARLAVGNRCVNLAVYRTPPKTTQQFFDELASMCDNLAAMPGDLLICDDFNTSGIPETDTVRYRFVTRFKNWGDYPFNFPCSANKWFRQICVLSVGDLPLLAKRPELFANKFYLTYEPYALDCMEELHYNRTRDELAGKNRLDLTFYEELDFVKNHVHVL